MVRDEGASFDWIQNTVLVDCCERPEEGGRPRWKQTADMELILVRQKEGESSYVVVVA